MKRYQNNQTLDNKDIRTIRQHEKILEQLDNIKRYQNNQTTLKDIRTIRQHEKILEQLDNMKRYQNNQILEQRQH